MAIKKPGVLLCFSKIGLQVEKLASSIESLFAEYQVSLSAISLCMGSQKNETGRPFFLISADLSKFLVDHLFRLF